MSVVAIAVSAWTVLSFAIAVVLGPFLAQRRRLACRHI